MKKVKFILIGLGLAAVSFLNASSDDRRGYDRYGNQPQNAIYQKECGSCHFPYQAGFLPKRSWNKIMDGLEKHFGTDASLDENDNKEIRAYLSEYAGDSNNANYKYFQKINRDISSSDTPLRISETRYFKKEHRKIGKKEIEQDEVKSLSHCQKCHTTADKGSYSERDINIPNYGRWDD